MNPGDDHRCATVFSARCATRTLTYSSPLHRQADLRGQTHATGGERLEVDVAADGTILQVEEPIAVDALPDAVKKAFAAKYPGAKATGANKQTAGKDIRYEIAFVVDKARKEATFSASGAFVDEE
jgi:hypothetical protein